MRNRSDTSVSPLPPSSSEIANNTHAAWAAVASLALGVFGMVTSEFLPASLLTPIARDLGVSVGMAGQTVTVTAAVAACAAPLIVVMTARLNRRLVVWALMTLVVLANLLAAVSTNVWVLLLARFGMGIALGGTWALSAALVMRLLPPHLHAGGTALVFGGIAAATVCAPSLGAYLGDLWGWRAAFMLVAGLALLALVIQLRVMPSMPPQPSPGMRAFGILLRRRNIQLGFLTVLLVFSGHFAGFTYLRPLLEQVPKLDIQSLSLALLIFGLGGLIGNFAGGWLAGRSVKGMIFFAAMLLSIAGCTLFVQGSSVAVAFSAVALWGIAFGALPVGTQLWTSHSGADHAENAGALLVTTTQFAIAIGSVIGGLLVDSLGVVASLGYVAIASFAGGLVILAGSVPRPLNS
ncbi:MFS transporter [Phytopseudomonas dryadis]|uniref:MFS transporter n=1 Tax=Phytopseudomonas dryadis TaxID=2487520 RepID=A0A4Q9QUL1_9GAMM|nr:MFS transporter [Pseudomonas dryadis]TBU86315.1 MFS transporter [Pseudomonas dryadis]